MLCARLAGVLGQWEHRELTGPASMGKSRENVSRVLDWPVLLLTNYTRNSSKCLGSSSDEVATVEFVCVTLRNEARPVTVHRVVNKISENQFSCGVLDCWCHSQVLDCYLGLVYWIIELLPDRMNWLRLGWKHEFSGGSVTAAVAPWSNRVYIHNASSKYKQSISLVTQTNFWSPLDYVCFTVSLIHHIGIVGSLERTGTVRCSESLVVSVSLGRNKAKYVFSLFNSLYVILDTALNLR